MAYNVCLVFFYSDRIGNQTVFCFVFFFNDTATTEIYTLSLHDALPISGNFVLFGAGIGESDDPLTIAGAGN